MLSRAGLICTQVSGGVALCIYSDNDRTQGLVNAKQEIYQWVTFLSATCRARSLRFEQKITISKSPWQHSHQPISRVLCLCSLAQMEVFILYNKQKTNKKVKMSSYIRKHVNYMYLFLNSYIMYQFFFHIKPKEQFMNFQPFCSGNILLPKSCQDTLQYFCEDKKYFAILKNADKLVMSRLVRYLHV